MSKNIWIINEYAGSPHHGMEFRSYYIAKELVKLGHSVTIVSSSYSHVFRNQPKVKRENIEGIDYLWLQTLNYGLSHDRRRILKWFIFSLKIFFLPFMLKKPDVIVVSPMAPFPIFPAWLLSKIHKAKLIYEVKDIWPLSIIELGGFSSSHPFIKFMSWFEKLALHKSDILVSNLQNYGDHIQDLGIQRDFKWISNGVDLEELINKKPLDKAIQKQIPKNKFIVGYTGAIGEANALESFLQSARILKEYRDIVLVIVGDGPKKPSLVKEYTDENIIFIDSIPKLQVQSMLHFFDGCYIGLKKERLFKFGVSPNKLYDYMYSAKPIIYAIDSGKKNAINTALCGIEAKAEDEKDIAKSIIALYNMSEDERDTMGRRGKEHVVKNFNYKELAKEFNKLL